MSRGRVFLALLECTYIFPSASITQHSKLGEFSISFIKQETEKSALTRASGFFFTARFLPLPKSYTDRFFHTKYQNLVTHTRLG